MKIDKAEDTAQEMDWRPANCECCNEPFDPENWASDWSLAEGIIWWICPKCKHPNYPRSD